MEEKIFEYNQEKILINALRLFGVVEYDSELLDIESSQDKVLMVTVKETQEDKKENEKFKYGLCPIKFGEYFSTQKNLFNLKKECESMSIFKSDILPLYYLSDYKNIITATEDEMRNKIMHSEEITSLEELKEKYTLLQIKDIIKNMRSNNFLPINGYDSETFDKSMKEFLSKLLVEYLYLGHEFYKSFLFMNKTNMEKSIKEYPGCKELENIYKTLDK